MRKIVWIFGGLIIGAVAAMIMVMAFFEDLIRDQVVDSVSPMIEGGVRLGELEFDTATGWTRIEQIDAGTAAVGFTAGPVVLTVELESMTRSNQLVISEVQITDMTVRGNGDTAAALSAGLSGLLRPAAPTAVGASEAEELPVRLEKLLIERVVFKGLPNDTLTGLNLSDIGGEQGGVAPDLFLGLLFDGLHQHIMDAGARSRAE